MVVIRFLLLLTAFVAAAGPAAQRTPVLLELFTSEGCSDCPAADRLLETLDRTQPAAGADLIVMSEHVDYFNNLGWVDRFSSPQFTARQQNYCERLHVDGPYTPQMVVDGRAQMVGSRAADVQAAIQSAEREAKVPVTVSAVTRDGARVSAHVDVKAVEGHSAELYLALADDHAETQVKRGENAGRALQHVAVVRALVKVASIRKGQEFAKDVSATLPSGAGTNGLRVLAIVQDSNGGRVIGVAQGRL